MILREALARAEAQLASSDIPHAKLDAEVLLLLALGREGDRAYLLAHPDSILNGTTEEHYSRLVAERATGKPMQYITGHQEFWGLDFLVTPDVLIPRPETEHSVEAALQLASQISQNALRVIDVGTGSGCIAIALAHALPSAELTAVDVSPAALAIARQNAQRNLVAVRFLESDLLTAVADEQFDVIVSNPPYVAADHPETVQRQVRDFEPSLALFAGPSGLDIYARLIPSARARLRSGGYLVLEIGYSMETPVRALLAEQLWRGVTTIPDLQGIPRVITAQSR